jgi:hypothetical protein
MKSFSHLVLQKVNNDFRSASACLVLSVGEFTMFQEGSDSLSRAIRVGRTITLSLFFSLCTSKTLAQVQNDGIQREHVKKFYTSLTGSTPTRQEINLLLDASQRGNLFATAYDIIESRNGFQSYGAFYNITVRDFATPWSTEDASPFTELNDLTATVVGYTRDEKPFNEILWRDTVYKAVGVVFKGGQLRYFRNSSFPSGTSASTVCQGVVSSDRSGSQVRVWYIDPLNPNSSPNDVNNTGCRLTKYSWSDMQDAFNQNKLYIPSIDTIVETNRIKESNNHYRSLEGLGIDLSNRDIIRETSQQVKLHRDPAAIAGLLSTRAFGKAYYSAGTNRAALAFSMKYFFCKDMEELNDTSIPDYRNRRDVDRSPGGNSTLYKNRCIGCHAGMDALAGAFAYYDYNGGITYEPGVVVTKMNHNAIFADGHVTNDDSWINLWDKGQNGTLGWGAIKAGNGAKDLGRLFASSEAFPKCMSEQVFKKVCFRKAVSEKDHAIVEANTNYFKANQYNMKKLFIKTAMDCMQ